jgi:hypothetical protein
MKKNTQPASGGKKSEFKAQKVVHEKHFKLMTKRQRRERWIKRNTSSELLGRETKIKKSFRFPKLCTKAIFILIRISFQSILSG